MIDYVSWIEKLDMWAMTEALSHVNEKFLVDVVLVTNPNYFHHKATYYLALVPTKRDHRMVVTPNADKGVVVGTSTNSSFKAAQALALQYNKSLPVN